MVRPFFNNGYEWTKLQSISKGSAMKTITFCCYTFFIFKSCFAKTCSDKTVGLDFCETEGYEKNQVPPNIPVQVNQSLKIIVRFCINVYLNYHIAKHGSDILISDKTFLNPLG